MAWRFHFPIRNYDFKPIRSKRCVFEQNAQLSIKKKALRDIRCVKRAVYVGSKFVHIEVYVDNLVTLRNRA